MRTALFLLSGFLLLGAVFTLARLFAANVPGAAFVATVLFVVVWGAITGANMWLGVTKAGYSAGEELPIFLLLLGLPVAAALLVKWRWL